MKDLENTRVTLIPVRYVPWYRWNWFIPVAIFLSVIFTVFMIWCMAKAVR